MMMMMMMMIDDDGEGYGHLHPGEYTQGHGMGVENCENMAVIMLTTAGRGRAGGGAGGERGMPWRPRHLHLGSGNVF